MKEKALSHFRRAPERYNCAQSVIKSAEKHFDISHADIEEMRASGSGRADGGLCGALYAAKTLMTDETCKENAREYFRRHAGSINCREIRAEGRMSCRDCVAKAAELAEHCFLKQNRKPEQ